MILYETDYIDNISSTRMLCLIAASFVFCLTQLFAVNVQELAGSASYGINEMIIPNKQYKGNNCANLPGGNLSPSHHTGYLFKQVKKYRLINQKTYTK